VLGAPLPKFAKALIKLARANPKKILSKKEVRPRRVAKDDSKALEMKAKRSREEFMKDVKIKPRAKDDMDLLSIAKKLEEVDIAKIKETEVNTYTNKLKFFFDSAKSLLKNENKADLIVGYIEKMSKFVDMFGNIDNTSITEDTTNEIQKVVNKLRDESLKVKGGL
jgi:hypothetical protein